MNKPVSIVILTWNNLHFLKDFLPVLQDRTPRNLAEILIADNGSQDGTVQWLEEFHPEIPLLSFGFNLGFTGGYIQALREVKTPYALLLNSDVEVRSGWLQPLLKTMENEKIGAVMPKILSHADPSHFEYAGASGGFIDRYGYPFCRGRLFNAIEQDIGQYNTSREVFWATGACLMVRMKAYEESGGLDPAFFAHMEEIDLCWRMHRIGYEIHVNPESEVLHVGGGSLPNETPHKIYLNFRNNLLLLQKNLPDEIRSKTLFRRKLLDGIAAFQYLIKFKWRFVMAILKAHRHYGKMKKQLNRSDIPHQTVEETTNHPGWYNGSVVSAFFLSRIRDFQHLPLKHWKN